MSKTGGPLPGQKPALTLAESLRRQAESRQAAQDAAAALYEPPPKPATSTPPK